MYMYIHLCVNMYVCMSGPAFMAAPSSPLMHIQYDIHPAPVGGGGCVGGSPSPCGWWWWRWWWWVAEWSRHPTAEAPGKACILECIHACMYV